MRGRKRSRCSSVPWANSAGAPRLSPSGLSRPRLYGASTASISRAVGDVDVEAAVLHRPRRHDEPDAANVGYHASYSANVRTSRIGRPAGRGVAPRLRHVSLDPRQRASSAAVRRVAHRPLELRVALLAERLQAFAEVLAPARQLQGERLVAQVLVERVLAPRCAAATW